MSFGAPKRPAGFILERRLTESLGLKYEKNEAERTQLERLFGPFMMSWHGVMGVYPSEDVTLAFNTTVRLLRKKMQPLIHTENAIRNILIVEGRAAAAMGPQALEGFWDRRTPDQQEMLREKYQTEWAQAAARDNCQSSGQIGAGDAS